MRNSLVYELFKKYNTRNYTDPYLICPLCKKPFCNSFGGPYKNNCKRCKEKQQNQLGEQFCGNTDLVITPAHCNCGNNNQMDRGIIILYLKVLLDYIDNLEYQLVCKEEGRDYEVTR